MGQATDWFEPVGSELATRQRPTWPCSEGPHRILVPTLTRRRPLPTQTAGSSPPSLHLHHLRHCSILLFGAGWLLEVGLIGSFWVGDMEIRASSWSWQFCPLRPHWGLNLGHIHSSDSPGSGGAPNTHCSGFFSSVVRNWSDH